MLTGLTRQLGAGHSLTAEQVADAVDELTRPDVDPAIKADFLTALARKGETPEEIAGFALALRDRSLRPELDPVTRAGEILDVVGTGGDGLSTLNISTAVAILTASAGVTTAKHGNRAVTSRCGSADVLEALGIRIDLAPPTAALWLRRHHFAFFFAPQYHPAFRHVAPARRICAERGQRTLFNFLGPLLNPARPTVQLMGVPRPALCEPLARVLQLLGVRRAFVVSGEAAAAAMDELSTLGPNTVAEFHHLRGLLVSTFDPRDLGVGPATLADLQGSDASTNATLVRGVLRGDDQGPRRDIIRLNAAAALFLAGQADSLTQGWELTGQLIDAGKAAAKLDELVAASQATD